MAPILGLLDFWVKISIFFKKVLIELNQTVGSWHQFGWYLHYIWCWYKLQKFGIYDGNHWIFVMDIEYNQSKSTRIFIEYIKSFIMVIYFLVYSSDVELIDNISDPNQLYLNTFEWRIWWIFWGYHSFCRFRCTNL